MLSASEANGGGVVLPDKLDNVLIKVMKRLDDFIAVAVSKPGFTLGVTVAVARGEVERNMYPLEPAQRISDYQPVGVVAGLEIG